MITPLQQLQSILTEQYTSQEGEEYTIVLKKGLTDYDIDGLAIE